jgi:histidine triad (HIT) family protein
MSEAARVSETSLFEKIRDREIPAEIVHEDDQVLAFRDIAPQAPIHILIVPKHRIDRVGAARPEHQDMLGALLLAAAEIARNEGIDETGYRLVINHGPHGGETVPHLHVHLLGGRPLHWPPG